MCVRVSFSFKMAMGTPRARSCAHEQRPSERTCGIFRHQQAGLVVVCVAVLAAAETPRCAASSAFVPALQMAPRAAHPRSTCGACALRVAGCVPNSGPGPQDASKQQQTDGFVWRMAPSSVPRIVKVEKMQQAVRRRTVPAHSMRVCADSLVFAWC